MIKLINARMTHIKAVLVGDLDALLRSIYTCFCSVSLLGVGEDVTSSLLPRVGVGVFKIIDGVID